MGGTPGPVRPSPFSGTSRSYGDCFASRRFPAAAFRTGFSVLAILREEFWKSSGFCWSPEGGRPTKCAAWENPGKSRIAAFIECGGAYIGFCGGAGMALSSPPAIFLTPVERMPLAERLPSASGGIRIDGLISHPCWKDLPPTIPVSVWWPSQFRVTPTDEAICLASYADAETDFQVADLRVSDPDPAISWSELEQAYGINLNPARIKGHPAIIEAQKGSGRMILSYAHLETPGDEWGNRLFFQILDYLNETSGVSGAGEADYFAPHDTAPADERIWTHIRHALDAASDLISFGEANLLWNWRRPWLLNWKRGIRGLEYGTLAVTLSYMAALHDKPEADSECGSSVPARAPGCPAAPGDDLLDRAKKLEEITGEFCIFARRLLLEEKFAARTTVLSKLGKVNERVDALRRALFGNRMHHGGLCRSLFDIIDVMLLEMLRAGDSAERGVEGRWFDGGRRAE